MAIVAATLVSAACVGIAASNSMTIAYGMLVLFVACVIWFLFFRQPVHVLLGFVALLPVHSLLLTILIVQLGAPILIAKAVASWKEALLLGTFIIIISYVMLQHAPVRLVFCDWMAIAWFALVLIYFAFHDVLFGWDSSLTVRFYGARDWLLYLLPYFIGRFALVSSKGLRTVLVAILLVGAVTSAIAIVEYVFIPVSWHVALGVPEYFADFLNVEYPAYLYGLPHNYWGRMGSLLVRRAVSVYLSSQGFALPFLLIMPVALWAHLTQFIKRHRAILALCCMGLLLTITRMTIIVCMIQTILVLAFLGRKRLALQIAILGAVLLIITMLVSAPLREFVWQTLTLSDTSSSARPGQWVAGIQALVNHPLGSGLGSTGEISARLGTTGEGGAGTESGYFKLTGALGLPGVVLFAAWFYGILAYSYAGYRRLGGIWRGLALVTFVSAIGFLLNNLTAPPDQSTFVIYLFGWLAGMTVQHVMSRPPVRPGAPVQGECGPATRAPVPS